MGWSDPPQLFDESSDAAAFAQGLFDGFRRLDPRPGAYPSAERDPYYYKIAYVLGYVLKILVLVAVARYGLA